MMDIFKEFTFEAAHRLTKFPEDHKCFRLHGHSYRVKIEVRGRPDDETGIVVDFGEITGAWKELCFPLLDHRYLNNVEGLENPTAENLCYWIWDRLKPRVHGLTCVTVRETCTAGASWMGWDRKADNLVLPEKGGPAPTPAQDRSAKDAAGDGPR